MFIFDGVKHTFLPSELFLLTMAFETTVCDNNRSPACYNTRNSTKHKTRASHLRRLPNTLSSATVSGQKSTPKTSTTLPPKSPKSTLALATKVIANYNRQAKGQSSRVSLDLASSIVEKQQARIDAGQSPTSPPPLPNSAGNPTPAYSPATSTASSKGGENNSNTPLDLNRPLALLSPPTENPGHQPRAILADISNMAEKFTLPEVTATYRGAKTEMKTTEYKIFVEAAQKLLKTLQKANKELQKADKKLQRSDQKVQNLGDQVRDLGLLLKTSEAEKTELAKACIHFKGQENEIEALTAKIQSLEQELQKLGGGKNHMQREDILEMVDEAVKDFLFRTWKFCEDEEDKRDATKEVYEWIKYTKDVEDLEPEEEFVPIYMDRVNTALSERRSYLAGELRKRCKGKLHCLFCNPKSSVILQLFVSLFGLESMDNSGMAKCFSFMLAKISCFLTPDLLYLLLCRVLGSPRYHP